MKIQIIAVGKLKNSLENQIINEYLKRIKNIEIFEVEASNSLASEAKKLKEAELMIEKIAPKNYLIALDVLGKNLSTEDFAALLNEKTANKPVSFIIGGADGIHPKLLEKADFKLSFGKMVFPHKLARIMLVEQLYRISSLQQNHPYHRG